MNPARRPARLGGAGARPVRHPDLGVVDNYAAFAAAGVEIVATPVCDAGMTASAAIDQSGRILLNLYAIEPGEHQVSVTLSAAGCQPVTVAQITLTVPEAQP